MSCYSYVIATAWTEWMKFKAKLHRKT